MTPFLLRPAVKDNLWGGTRLRDDFHKETDFSIVAETWECSTHPSGESIVVTGKNAGMTLTQVLKKNPEYLGKNALDADGQLPILIKFIDAKQDLSVQVHPSDDYARDYENGQRGKTEMWYVVDAAEGATLVYGLKHELTKEQLRESIADGSLADHLNTVPIHKGDVFFIPAGTIHAIGAGALIAEIQQSSNLTYRLFDYNRRDAQGNLRELHVEKSLAVSKLTPSGAPAPERIITKAEGATIERLCACEYFYAERLILNASYAPYSLNVDDSSFRAFLCLDGSGTLRQNGARLLSFTKGDCIFIPAGTSNLEFSGTAQFLTSGVEA